jgi:hypothetical protein
MRARVFLTVISVLSLFFSSSVLAHITGQGNVLPHIFTGEHLLTLVIIGLCVVGLTSLYRRFR